MALNTQHFSRINSDIYMYHFIILQILIMSTGDVIFVPPVIHRTFCPIDFSSWPWGEQNCTLIFGSWTYHENVLDLQPLKDDSSHMEPLDVKEFVNPRVICIS